MGIASRPLVGCCVLLLALGCWLMEDEEPMPDQHELEGPVDVTTPAIQRIYEFHGHVGPYVVLGFRAGELARELLESPGYFDLKARATCPLETPTSCFLDGLQLGSGCTVGKRNLEVAGGKRIGSLFQTKSGRSVRITLKEELPERIRAWIQQDGVDATGERVMKLPRDDVFVIEVLQ